MGKKRDYGGSEDSPDACFGGLGSGELCLDIPPVVRDRQAAAALHLHGALCHDADVSTMDLIRIYSN